MKAIKSHLFLFGLTFLLVLFSFSSSASAEEFVAQIGDTKFTTLNEAIEQVKKGEAITVLQNIYVEESIIIDKNKSIDFTINLNEHFVDGTNMIEELENSKSYSIFEIKNGTVTFENGSIINNHQGNERIIPQYRGGAICSFDKTSAPNITVRNVEIRDNKAATGSGIYMQSGSLTIEDSLFENNSSSTNSSAIYILADSVKTTIKNTDFINNHSDSSAGNAAVIQAFGEFNAYNCKFEGNSAMLVKSGNGKGKNSVIYFDTDTTTAKLEKCQFIENKSIENTISVLNVKNSVTLEDCLISDNTTARTGGILVNSGKVILDDVVIKNNTVTDPEVNTLTSVYPSGGISVYTGTLTYRNGALYNNVFKASDKDESINDLYINSKANVEILQANSMIDKFDESSDFSNYVWIDENFKKFDQLLRTSNIDNELLSAFDNSPRAIAKIDNKEANFATEFKDVIDAVLSNETDQEVTLELINNGLDQRYLKFKSDNIDIIRPVHLILNEHTLFEPENKTIFTINDRKSLKIDGSGTIIGDIVNNGDLSFGNFSNNDKLNIDMFSAIPASADNAEKTIDYSGTIVLKGNSSLTLNHNFINDFNIKIEDTQYNPIHVGDSFNCSNLITISLPEELIEQLNSLNEDVEDIRVPLFYGDVSKIDYECLKLEKVSNINFTFERINSVLYAVNSSSNTLSGIYFSSNAPEEGTGTFNKPFNSFEQAKNDAIEKNETTVYLKDNFVVLNDTTWNSEGSENPITIKRISLSNDLHNQDLIEIKNGSLILDNVIIDGQVRPDFVEPSYDEESSQNITPNFYNAGSIVSVGEKGTLVLNNNSVLTNNSIIKGSTADSIFNVAGGAVNTKGKVILNSGQITNCEALLGGAIYGYGPSATILINNGEIRNNQATQIDLDSSSYGGGICTEAKAALILNNGTIQGNRAVSKNEAPFGSGGGISIGRGSYYSLGDRQEEYESDFIMTGGSISENMADGYGGGLYIQGNYTGYIEAGDILNNLCTNPSHFGGGGIYVNGSFNEDKLVNGELTLTNVEITNNVAHGHGGGIAACRTGSTIININNGSAIYGNFGSFTQKDDIALQTGDGALLNFYDETKLSETEDHIGKFMIDETPYNWRIVPNKKDEESGPLASEDYLNGFNGKHLYTDSTFNETNPPIIKTRIQGNEAYSRGGGIASNGNIIIGEEESTETLEVIKNWSQDKNSALEAFKQINIWIFSQRNEKIFYTFNPLYRYNLETDQYDWFDNVKFEKPDNYIIVEEAILKNDQHIWSVPEWDQIDKEFIQTNIINQFYDEETNWIFTDDPSSVLSNIISQEEDNQVALTNTLNTRLVISKELEGNVTIQDQEKNFTFNIDFSFKGNRIKGNYYKSSDPSKKHVLSESSLTFTLKANEYIVFDELPAETTYTLTETPDNVFDSSYIINEEQLESIKNRVIHENEVETVRVINTKNGDIPEEPTVFKRETKIGDRYLVPEDFRETGYGQAGPSVDVGDRITYKIYWYNVSSAEDGSIKVIEPLDRGFDFISASFEDIILEYSEGLNNTVTNEDESISISYDLKNHKVIWTFNDGAIYKNGSVELEVEVNDEADKLWNYDTTDPQISNSDIEEADHQVVNKAIIIGKSTQPTGEVSNLLKGLFIEKIHMISSKADEDSYVQELGDGFSLPDEAVDEREGKGFTNKFSADTDENEYKALIDHELGNTVRYFIKITNTTDQTLKNIVVLDPLNQIPIDEDGKIIDDSDVLTVFPGVAGKNEELPWVEGRALSTQSTFLDDNLDGIPDLIEENDIITFTISSSWDESWGNSSITIEDIIPDWFEFVSASYIIDNTDNIELTADNLDGVITGPEGSGVEITRTEVPTVEDPDQIQTMITWKYTLDGADDQEDNKVEIKLKAKRDLTEDESSNGSVRCRIIRDEVHEDPEILAIYNKNDTQNFLRWGITQLNSGESEIVYFDIDLPEDIDKNEMFFDNVAYVQEYETLLKGLKTNLKDSDENYVTKDNVLKRAYSNTFNEELPDSDISALNFISSITTLGRVLADELPEQFTPTEDHSNPFTEFSLDELTDVMLMSNRVVEHVQIDNEEPEIPNSPNTPNTPSTPNGPSDPSKPNKPSEEVEIPNNPETPTDPSQPTIPSTKPDNPSSEVESSNQVTSTNQSTNTSSTNNVASTSSSPKTGVVDSLPIFYLLMGTGAISLLTNKFIKKRRKK